MDTPQFNTSVTCELGGFIDGSILVVNPDTAIALGYLFSFAFFGILIVQAFIYFSRFPNDAKFLRYLVWTIMLLESLSSAFVVYALWKGALGRCLICGVTDAYTTCTAAFATGSFTFQVMPSFAVLLSNSWSFSALSTLTGIITSMVHAFFCWRMRVISRSLVVPVIVMLISLLQCAFVIFGGSTSNLAGGGVVASTVEYLWLGGSFVCDVIITVYTTWVLFRNRSKSNFDQTKSLLSRLIKLTVETGMVMAIATLLELILAVELQQFEHLIIFYPLSKLYANCMLASLNARLVIRGEDATCHKTPTLLFQDVERDGIASGSSLSLRPAVPNATRHHRLEIVEDSESVQSSETW